MLKVTFSMPRPASHFGAHGLRPRAPRWPSKKPDLSKLVRAIEDALTGVVYDDDARIVMHDITKRYAEPGSPPRAEIVVETLQESEP
jgi:crossover junction endodeoxyribonuclease RusA